LSEIRRGPRDIGGVIEALISGLTQAALSKRRAAPHVVTKASPGDMTKWFASGQQHVLDSVSLNTKIWISAESELPFCRRLRVLLDKPRVKFTMKHQKGIVGESLAQLALPISKLVHDLDLVSTHSHGRGLANKG
jgi:hypothetical protein